MNQDDESMKASVYAVLDKDPKASLTKLERETNATRPTVHKWRKAWRAEHGTHDDGGEEPGSDTPKANDFQKTFPPKKRKKPTTTTTPGISQAAEEIEVRLR